MERPITRVVAYFWHPLPIWEIANNGHVDALAVALMLLGLWVALTGHAMRGVVSIALGALVKPYVAPALASIWRPWDWKVPLVVIAAIALCYLPYFSVGWGVFGFLTNLFGGYIGARFGLKTTLFIGLGTQLVALSMLAFAPPGWMVVAYVMVSQALSGIAKDMTKMSSKSAVKLIVPEDASATLYRWVAILTGSKNALKGVGFFLGGLLLTLFDFQTALKFLVMLVGAALIIAATLMRGGLGQANKKAKFARCFPAMARSTNSQQRAFSSSERAMSGSSSACRSFCPACLAGTSGRRAGFSLSG
jgi:hypothetical protein